MRSAVYILSSLTAGGVSVLLLRSYVRSRVRLLFWSGICFIGLTANSVMLFIDEIIIPDRNLQIMKTSVAFAGMLCLLYGLIWESRS